MGVCSKIEYVFKPNRAFNCIQRSLNSTGMVFFWNILGHYYLLFAETLTYVCKQVEYMCLWFVSAGKGAVCPWACVTFVDDMTPFVTISSDLNDGTWCLRALRGSEFDFEGYKHCQ